MVADTVELTVMVEIEKFAVEAPAGTRTDVGTVAEEVLVESVTATPPEEALPVNVTVPIEEDPPETAEGLTETDARARLVLAVMLRSAVLLRPA
jgi:hypothetical protein